MPIERDTTQQVKTLCQELAEMEVRCPKCAATGKMPCECVFDSIPHNKDKCDNCGGSGKVSRFPGVRVPCPFATIRLNINGWQDKGDVLNYEKHQKGDCLCHGKGWVASTDMAVWIQAAKQIAAVVAFSRRGVYLDDILVSHPDEMLALLTALREWAWRKGNDQAG